MKGMKVKKSTRRDELIKFLENKSSYPHNPKSLKHIQTHASDVFIVPPYVYKVKKSVNLRFLDFSTLSKRKHFCEIEVELNRRLSEGIYLGVEKISRKNGKLIFGRGEKVVEYAVKMKRLPEKYFIKNLLKKGLVSRRDFAGIVKRLVTFYKDQPSITDIKNYGSPESIKFTIDENLELTKKFINKTISSQCYGAIKLYNELYFKKYSKLFKKRIQLGFIKDCHGDLHLEHINLAPGRLNIFDCIEFNNRFRYIDIASDLAFLAMDLDFNGYRKYSDFVISEFSKRIKDKTIYEIIDFYKCYRAYVRGKVESIRCQSKDVSEKDRKISFIRAKKYFNLALRYSLFGSKPFVIVVFGLIGTGKSTIAKLLAEELSAVVVSSDKVRKEITSTKLTERKFKGYSKGIYTSNITNKTYKELLRRGIKEINNGNNVILDASYSKKLFREMVKAKAKQHNVSLLFIETSASKNTIRKRLLERERKKTISDARWEIFEDFKKQYEKPEDLNKNIYLKINTNKNKEETVDKTFKKLINMMNFKH
ncbi:MAG: AAA family ATPase [Candidatus Dadabacteria bacterium]|nr:AAA family ATPase [Candidatus Dadabacteria bacterium]NIQ15707.1 AAA family ATPase [Candidatus Dadabacteria bacterium]